MRNKRVIAAGCAAVMTMTMASQALAGEWKQNETGWWWQEEDGSYPVDTWKWLDGNGDGISECYYFNHVGYLVTGTTTPDQYQVNEDGAWTENGIVQTKEESEGESSGMWGSDITVEAKK